MPVVRIDLEYDGAGFAGWAMQPGARTIEGELRRALTAVLPGPFSIAVAGRTDAGVHATGQVVSVAGPSTVDPWRLRSALRGLLPRDIDAYAVSAASEAFDARRDALTRRYEYRVLAGRSSALRRGRVLEYYRDIDDSRLEDCAAAVRGRHDFRAFTPARSRHARFTRTVVDAGWERRGDERVFSVEANSFLHHMVRVMVGTMLETASGLRSAAAFRDLLAPSDRAAAGPTAPAHPLTLVAVTYPQGEPASR